MQRLGDKSGRDIEVRAENWQSSDAKAKGEAKGRSMVGNATNLACNSAVERR